MSNDSLNFTPLSSEEVKRKLAYVSKNELELYIWIKGKKDKEKVKAKHFNAEEIRLHIENEDKTKSRFLSEEVLVNYNIKGLNFFATAIVNYNDSIHANYLQFVGQFYKCERRENFRLLTYPTYSVYCFLRITDNFSQDEQTSILDFSKTKSGNTSLFRQFIDLVDTKEQEELKEDQVLLRVLDLSVSGIALIAGKLEKEYFEDGKELHNLRIKFEGKDLKIPKAEVVYSKPHKIHNRESVEQFKIGVRFTKVPANVDDNLGKLINEHIKETDIKKVFEKFLNE